MSKMELSRDLLGFYRMNDIGDSEKLQIIYGKYWDFCVVGGVVVVVGRLDS